MTGAPEPAGITLSDGELQAIETAMKATGADVIGPLRADLIAGGRSNLTYVLSDSERRWVLRTPPRVGRTPSAHDVAREYRVTNALADTLVPVARPVLLSENETILGVPFVIVDYVEGVSIRSRDELDQLDDTEVGGLVNALIDCLVNLHAVDYRAVGLETFGRPNGYAERQLKRWAGQWEIVGTEALAGLARDVVAGLSKFTSTDRPSAIVHGDFRLDNTLVRRASGQQGPGVAALVDWELSTIGDPLADVAMMCAYRDPAFDLIVGAPSSWTSPRLPAADDLAQRYVSAGGYPLDGWGFHLALAYFKIAVIAAGIDHRYRAGASTGPGFDTSGMSVEPYLEMAAASLKKA